MLAANRRTIDIAVIVRRRRARGARLSPPRRRSHRPAHPPVSHSAATILAREGEIDGPVPPTTGTATRRENRWSGTLSAVSAMAGLAGASPDDRLDGETVPPHVAPGRRPERRVIRTGQDEAEPRPTGSITSTIRPVCPNREASAAMRWACVTRNVRGECRWPCPAGSLIASAGPARPAFRLAGRLGLCGVHRDERSRITPRGGQDGSTKAWGEADVATVR